MWAVVDAPVGPLLLAATDEGLLLVAFHAPAGGPVAERALDRLRGRLGAEEPGGSGERGAREDPGGAATGARSHLERARAELADYFAGRLRDFTVPLDWSLTGGFHARVLRELASGVPYGATAGYQDLADRVGEPGAARAVGVAMGANPLPVVVPCHRIVASDGGIGGFGGGLETKRALLALEGVLPEPLF